MKKIIAGTLALTLLGSTAAYAHDWHAGEGYDGGRYYRDHDNNGAAVAVGVGIAALALIAATHADHDRYQARGYYYPSNGYYAPTRYDYGRSYYGDRDGWYGDRHDNGWHNGWYNHDGGRDGDHWDRD